MLILDFEGFAKSISERIRGTFPEITNEEIMKFLVDPLKEISNFKKIKMFKKKQEFYEGIIKELLK